jgi:hypothetical protein
VLHAAPEEFLPLPLQNPLVAVLPCVVWEETTEACPPGPFRSVTCSLLVSPKTGGRMHILHNFQSFLPPSTAHEGEGPAWWTSNRHKHTASIRQPAGGRAQKRVFIIIFATHLSQVRCYAYSKNQGAFGNHELMEHQNNSPSPPFKRGLGEIQCRERRAVAPCTVSLPHAGS